MNTKTKNPTASKGAAKKPSEKKSPASSKGDSKSGLQQLFEDELKDIYWAEKALTKALPKMLKKITSSELAEAVENHLAETEEHVTKVEEVFELLGQKAQAKKCEAMDGLIKEAEELMSENEGVTRDAAIISAAQKVEHYEIASYGTLVAFAKILGLDDAAEILESILEQEKNADQTLTEVAESAINIEAAGEDEEEDVEEEEEA